MKFQPTINVWGITEAALHGLQRGQWVTAGSDGPRGTFCGVKPSGSVVVAWQGNARASGNAKTYRKALMNYAKGH